MRFIYKIYLETTGVCRNIH